MDKTIDFVNIMSSIPGEQNDTLSKEMDLHRKGHWFESSIAHHF